MSLISVAHTFVHWIEDVWTKIRQQAPKAEQLVELGINHYLIPGLQIALQEVEPNSPAAQAIEAVMKKALGLSSVVFDFGAHPGLSGAFTVLSQDIQAILDLGAIKNANVVSGITKAVQTIAALAAMLLQVAPVVAA